MSTNDTGLLPWETIAEIMDISVEEVRESYTFALNKMRDELSESGISKQEFEQYLMLRVES